MANDNAALVGRILLIGSAVLALLGALCWTGALPVEPAARRVMALAFTIAAAADGAIGFFFVRKARDSRP